MSAKLAATEADYDPVCPHCDQYIDVMHWRQIDAFNAEYVFICPHCHRILGVGVRKAAWID
ncbi:MAG: hypothetical protein ACYTHJ_10465 [Planctomycetota bacterium]